VGTKWQIRRRYYVYVLISGLVGVIVLGCFILLWLARVPLFGSSEALTNAEAAALILESFLMSVIVLYIRDMSRLARLSILLLGGLGGIATGAAYIVSSHMQSGGPTRVDFLWIAAGACWIIGTALFFFRVVESVFRCTRT
jgi:hypothetical protein